MLALLSQPVIAAVLGLACGVGLLLASRASFAKIQADDAARGILLSGLAMIGRLFLATVVMFLYSHFVHAGFAAFGLALAGSFLVGYMVELVRYAGLHRFSRPAAGSRDGR
ncbi:MAG: hypothetical protein KJ747_05305 [Actinobacteria bacterium]|nr:hypothetical protein [Actinomycetota bacterium]MCG2806900.1 hypothetical protein [Coriobacteriia bacterium]MDP2233627.1 hypothetical protein [Actinomycetota bacterium]